MKHARKPKPPAHILNAIGAADGEFLPTECPTYSELLALLREGLDMMPLGNLERLQWCAKVTTILPPYLR